MISSESMYPVLVNDGTVQRLLDRVDAWWEWHVEPRLPSTPSPE